MFFFGSAVGDDLSGERTTAFTNSTDDLDARSHPGVATITNIYDYNKDGFVNASDSLIVRNGSGSVRFINIGNPPSAPDVDPSATPNAAPAMATSSGSSPDVGIATALSEMTGRTTSGIQIPPWLANRLANINLNTGIAATTIHDFECAAEGTGPAAKLARRILVDADKIADALDLDDHLLDSVLTDLGLG